MDKLPHLFVVAAALYDAQKNAWLLAEHQKRDAYRGLWEFPGGKVESGETPEQALMREMKEELGIHVEEADMQPLTFASHAYPQYGFHLMMPLYKVQKWQGEISSELGQKFVWIPAFEFHTYKEKTLPANLPLIEFIHRYEIQK